MALAISKSALWPTLHYVPNRAQRAIHASTERFVVVAAGRRTGKSTAGGREIMPEAYRAYLCRQELEEHDLRHEYWCVGPQYSDSEKEFRRFYNDCKRLQMPFDKPGTYYDQRGGDMTVSLWGGRFLFSAKSAKYPDNLVGEGLSGVIMAEAAKMKKRIWDQYIRPTLADFHGWGKFTSTPQGRNWFHEFFTIGRDGTDPEFASHRFPSWMNEILFPLGRLDPEILSMMAGMSEEMAKQEIGAEFSEYVGQVFKDWDEDWHVRPFTYNPAWPLYLAADYGWTHPNVILFIQIDPFDRVYVLDEYYQTHRSAEEMAEDLLEGAQSPAHPALVRAATLLYPDPASPASSHTLAEKLKVRVMGGTGGDLAPRLEVIRKWLKDENSHLQIGHPDRRPKLLAHPRCKNFHREMDAYRYPETKDEENRSGKEKPMDKDDHTPEALGRLMIGHFGTEAIGGPPRQNKVQFRRRPVASRARRR